jgi:DNA-binding PadR family transcriptional regulator
MSKFERPRENWSKLPNQFVDEIMPEISTLSELKVILYILRHTWGFQDDDKRITLDEFENGRKRKDGTRIDKGCGLSHPSIVSGLKKAEKHGYIHVETDDSDKARIRKTYSIEYKSPDQGLKDLTPDVKEFNSSSKESLPRSEKETKERNLEKEKNLQDKSCADDSTPILYEQIDRDWETL